MIPRREFSYEEREEVLRALHCLSAVEEAGEDGDSWKALKIQNESGLDYEEMFQLVGIAWQMGLLMALVRERVGFAYTTTASADRAIDAWRRRNGVEVPGEC